MRAASLPRLGWVAHHISNSHLGGCTLRRIGNPFAFVLYSVRRKRHSLCFFLRFGVTCSLVLQAVCSGANWEQTKLKKSKTLRPLFCAVLVVSCASASATLARVFVLVRETGRGMNVSVYVGVRWRALARGRRCRRGCPSRAKHVSFYDVHTILLLLRSEVVLLRAAVSALVDQNLGFEHLQHNTA